MSRLRSAAARFLSSRTPGALRRLRETDEEGFTLIELVIVLVIMPLIIGAIAIALLVTFQDQVGVSTRVSTSADAQVTSAYFVRDVESAQYLTTAGTPANAAWPATAGETARCGSGTALVVTLAWPSGQQPISGGATVVSYWKEPHDVLVRDLCKAGPASTSSIASRDYVSPFTHVLLSCIGSQPSCGTAAAQGWVPAQSVSGVTLAVTASLTKGKYDYSLTAAPRASGTAGAFASGSNVPPGTPGTIAPLLALGSGNVVTENSAGGFKTKITVTRGNAVLNTGYFRMTNTTTFTAPAIEATKTPCTTFPHRAKCTGTIHPPMPATHLTAPVPDPLATILTDPTPVALGLPVVTTCRPHTGVLAPGEYECGGATTLTFSGSGTHVRLAHGIYIFDTGLQIKGGATLEGTTVLVYLPCRHGTVDPWVPSGTRAYTCREGFGVSNGHATMSPRLTGAYSNLWFWQNAGDTNTVTMHGQSAITVTTGVLYAPAAEVDLSGLGTQNTTVGAIIASTFRVANSQVSVIGFGGG